MCSCPGDAHHQGISSLDNDRAQGSAHMHNTDMALQVLPSNL